MELGLQGRATLTVSEDDTALALGSGDVPVLATPRLLALAEEAALAAVRGQLPPEETSVGSWVELVHIAPTRIGGTVEAVATLSSVDGHRLEFLIKVFEGTEEVAAARHRRAVVDRARFLS